MRIQLRIHANSRPLSTLINKLWGQWMTGFGRLFASIILRFPLSGVYEVIKFHRRQCAKYARDELAETDNAGCW
eukprot:gene11915-20215_t